MPELPEVEASRAVLEAHCAGEKIETAITVEGGGGPREGEFDSIVFDDGEATAPSIAKALEGKRLVEIRRRGKQLWLVLSSPPHLLAHFGMTGAFVVRGVAPLQFQEFKVHDEVWPPRFCKMELGFEKGTSLAFCDPRRLGRLRLRADPLHEDPWRSLAPDPLVDTIDAVRWAEVIGSKGCPIKALLLDQQALVSGVGNWVADEVLFHAGLHPEAICRSLTAAQLEQLRASLLHIIGVAVQCGADAKGFPSDWLFHYRWGKGAKNGAIVPGERGGAITFLTVGGRTSAVVLSRQKKGEGKVGEGAGKAGAGSGRGGAAAGKTSGKAPKKAPKAAAAAADADAAEAAVDAAATDAAAAASGGKRLGGKAAEKTATKGASADVAEVEEPTVGGGRRKKRAAAAQAAAPGGTSDLERELVVQWQCEREGKRARRDGL